MPVDNHRYRVLQFIAAMKIRTFLIDHEFFWLYLEELCLVFGNIWTTLILMRVSAFTFLWFIVKRRYFKRKSVLRILQFCQRKKYNHSELVCCLRLEQLRLQNGLDFVEVKY